MIRLPRHCARRSLRRSLLGIALVLHVAWVTLAAVPAIAGATPAMAVPCHGGMMAGMSMDDHNMVAAATESAPANPATSQLPCCAHSCACATGLCAISAPLTHSTPVLVQYPVHVASISMPPSRAPTPQLRPPILH